MRTLVTALAGVATLLAVETAVAQPPARGAAPATPRARAVVTHPDGLDCVACHVDKHQGVQRLYAGTGGRGAPPAPDRMFQVGVQCTACHTAPRSPEGARAIVGQNFGVAAQACVACHGARYGGLLERWRTGLAPRQAIDEEAPSGGVAAADHGHAYGVGRRERGSCQDLSSPLQGQRLVLLFALVGDQGVV